MMMMNNRAAIKPALLILLAAIAFGACKKEVGINQNLNPDDQTKFDFMSTKAGSWWRYSSLDTVGNETFTRFARDLDTIKNNLKYSYYERRTGDSGTIQPEYFGKNGDRYITLIDLDGNQSNYLEYVYYLDKTSQGSSFNNIGKVAAPGIGDVSIKLNSSISETNLSMPFCGELVNDIIHVHTDASAGLFSIRVGTLDTWIKKDLGVLKQEVHFNILGAFKLEHIDSLVSYHIEP